MRLIEVAFNLDLKISAEPPLPAQHSDAHFGVAELAAGVGAAGACVCAEPLPDVPDPKALVVVLTVNGLSSKLLTRVSTGTVGVGGFTGTGPVICLPGVAISLPVFGGK